MLCRVDTYQTKALVGALLSGLCLRLTPWYDSHAKAMGGAAC